MNGYGNRASRALLAVVLALLVAAATGYAATPRKGASFTGLSSQKGAIAFRVANTGRTMEIVVVRFVRTCSNNLTVVSEYVPAKPDRIRVSRKGAFSKVINIFAANGGTGTFTFGGRFGTRQRATGTFQEKLTFPDGVTCDSGVVRFSATD